MTNSSRLCREETITMPPKDQLPEIRVDCFLVCDFAQVSGGKLNILGGGWDRLSVSTFPYSHRFHIAIKLSILQPMAKQELPVRVVLTTPEDRPFGPGTLDAIVQADRAADALPGQHLGLIIPVLVEATFGQPGPHRIGLYVGEEQMAETMIYVAGPLAGPLESPALPKIGSSSSVRSSFEAVMRSFAVIRSVNSTQPLWPT
jgi:hypothetical protein